MLVERPLCSLYAEGLLWARNCAQKGSVNSVCSVRDKTPHDSYWQAYRGNLTFHSPPYGGGARGRGRSGKGEKPAGAGGEATVSSVRDNVFLSSKPFKKKKRPSTRSTVISE